MNEVKDVTIKNTMKISTSGNVAFAELYNTTYRSQMMRRQHTSASIDTTHAYGHDHRDVGLPTHLNTLKMTVRTRGLQVDTGAILMLLCFLTSMMTPSHANANGDAFISVDEPCLCDTTSHRDALLSIWALTGRSWTFNVTAPLCDWGNGGAVVCNGTIVTEVDLRGGGLFGNITTSLNLTKLASLRKINLSKNPLLYVNLQYIVLPPSVEVLRLANGITGSLPQMLGLPNLTEFSCQQCGLQGPLPTSWCADGLPGVAMQRLQAIQLSGNSKLVGPLPASWASCPLTLVDVSGVRSAGSVPPSWADTQQPMASTIVRLRLGSSGLVGAVPAAWFAAALFPVLQEVSAPSNGLNGSLPTNITSTSLATLDLSDNVLEGPLPQVLGVAMVTLSAARNRLSGELPTVLPRTLILVDLSDNVALSGSIPSAWSEGPQAPALQQILLGGCNLSGAVPQAWLYSSTVRESLTTLNISHNQLSGSLADGSSMQTAVTTRFLATLDVSWNSLTGVLPTFANAITCVDYSHNGFSGSVPVSLPTEYFDASYNVLSGAIRSWGANIIVLDLSCNQLSGALPADACVVGASIMNLSHNSLTGPLPESLGDTATTVDVSWNRFTLPLPAVGGSGLMNVLDASHNAFVGAVTGSLFSQQASLLSLDLSFNTITSIAVTGDAATPSQFVPCAPNLKFLDLSNCSLQSVPEILPDALQRLDVSSVMPFAAASPPRYQLSGLWRWSFALQEIDLSANANVVLLGVPMALCPRLIGAELIAVGRVTVAFPKITLSLLGTRVLFRARPWEPASAPLEVIVTSVGVADAWVASWCSTRTHSMDATASQDISASRLAAPASTTALQQPHLSSLSSSYSTLLLSLSRSLLGTSSRRTAKASQSESVDGSSHSTASQDTSASWLATSKSATALQPPHQPSLSSSYPTLSLSLLRTSSRRTAKASRSESEDGTSSHSAALRSTTASITRTIAARTTSTLQSSTLTALQRRTLSRVLPTASLADETASLTMPVAAMTAVSQLAKTASSYFSTASIAAVAVMGASQAGSFVAIGQGSFGARSLREKCTSQTQQSTFSDDEPFSDVTDNPTRLSLPLGQRGGLENAAGAVIGNAALVVVLSVGLTMARQVRRRCCRARSAKSLQHYSSLLIGTRLPGGLMGLFLILLLPSTAAVVYICASVASSSSEMSSGAIAALSAISAAGSVLFLGPVVAVSVYVARRVDVLVVSHAVEADPMDSLQLQWSNSWAARGRRLLRWMTYHRTHWTARSVDAPDNDVGGSHAASVEFALRYGQVFGVYNGRFRHFFLVEFGVVVCSGAVLGSALSAADACAALTWGGVVLAVLSGGLGASHMLLLPTTARLESLSIALVALLTCAAELCLTFDSSPTTGEALVVTAAVLELSLVCTGVVVDQLPRQVRLLRRRPRSNMRKQLKASLSTQDILQNATTAINVSASTRRSTPPPTKRHAVQQAAVLRALVVAAATSGSSLHRGVVPPQVDDVARHVQRQTSPRFYRVIADRVVAT